MNVVVADSCDNAIKRNRTIIIENQKNIKRIKANIMMDGMNNVWGMGGGWVIGVVVLIAFLWLGAKIVNRNNNSKMR